MGRKSVILRCFSVKSAFERVFFMQKPQHFQKNTEEIQKTPPHIARIVPTFAA
jgi:hypothetical protein